MRRCTRDIALVALALALAGCAPRVSPSPPRLEPMFVRSRFETHLAERRTRVGSVEGDYSAWVRRAGGRTPPGVTLHVRLLAPDAARLRIDGLLGTALDAMAHRDTLVVNAPSLGIALASNAGADRSKRQDLGGWIWRAMSATWTPAPAAWESGEPSDSLWRLRWIDGGDSLELAVGSTGLPRQARIVPSGGAPIEVRYERWAMRDGVWWPVRIVAGDSDGRLSATLQPQELRLRAARDSDAMAIAVPPGALSLSRSEVLVWLQRMALLSGAGGGTPADTIPVEGEQAP